MSQPNEECINAGSIDERGFLNTLTKLGLTDSQAINELVANCIDADARNIKFTQDNENISLIDDGNGMDIEGARNMACCSRENHTNERSKGVAGAGAKAGFIQLSKKNRVTVLTKQKSTPLIKIVFPWDKMFEEGIYTGQITINEVNDTSIIDKFNLERNEMNNPSQGTTVILPYNDIVYNDLRCNLLPVNQQKTFQDKYYSPTDRPSITFGRESNIKITYDLNQDGEKGEVCKYDYMKGEDNAFYKGISINEIEFWVANDTQAVNLPYRFILRDNEKPMEIKLTGSGFSSKVVQSTLGFKKYTHVGSFYHEVSCRRTPELFDETTGNTLYSGAKINLEFDKKDIHDTYDTFHLRHKVVRNNQIIGYIGSDKKDSSARSSSESRFEQENVQSYLTYETMSTQENNYFDDYIGTQVNKNQLNTTKIQKNFTRLLDHNRKEKAKEIEAYFTCIKSKISKEKRIAKQAEDARIAKEAEDARIAKEVEDAHIAQEEMVNNPLEESTQPEQVNQPSDESTQLEQVNGSSDNLIQLESTNLTSSSDDSSSSSEEDYSTSDESDIETAQLDDTNTEGTKQYSAEKLLTPENFESKNIDNEYLHDSSSAKASIENDIMITKYTKIFKETICDRLDFSNPEHRTLIDEFSQKLNQTSYSLEVSNSM